MADLLLTVLRLALAALAAYGFVDALRRPAGAFVAHSKQTKQIWLAILGVSTLAIFLFGVLSILGLPAIVAAIVYQVDVKPAVSGQNSW